MKVTSAKVIKITLSCIIYLGFLHFVYLWIKLFLLIFITDFVSLTLLVTVCNRDAIRHSILNVSLYLNLLICLSQFVRSSFKLRCNVIVAFLMRPLPKSLNKGVTP